MKLPAKRCPEAVVVRCLGPGREHSFRSPDPVRVRVCPDCRKKLDAIGAEAFRCSVPAAYQ